ncbi:uncharacterized protein [Epargyreus clarus]|uniref:uncharacterized protein n=1 Tax=Epargyreus clarus TaxID=520877 RepID=UPI003C2BC55C
MICGWSGAARVLLHLLLTITTLTYAVSQENESVTACLPGGGARVAAALAELAARALSAGGVAARAAPPPAACAPPARADHAACLRAVERELAAGRMLAAVLPVPAAAAPAAWRLRDAGLDELGDLTPPARRACWAADRPGRRPARSLLDLADTEIAAHYRISSDFLNAAIRNVDVTSHSIRINALPEPEWCQQSNMSCATMLTSEEGEAHLLQGVVREHTLRARVVALGARLPAVARALNGSGLVCDWALEASEFDTQLARPLGPPPCSQEDCPFESRRLIKLVKATALARSPASLRALLRLALAEKDLRELAAHVRTSDPIAAARNFLKDHPMHVLPREVRVTVFIPDGTPREVYDGIALTAAAASAEEDLEIRGEPHGARFKVEVYDDRCDAAHAYKYLLDALGTSDYGALSAVAGPACGAAFADVARQSPAHALPVLAYSAQAAPPGARALLAAGDARAASAALGAWLAHMRWRRLVVLSEAATHATLDAARLQANIVEHLELADEWTVDENDIIVQWAKRVAAARGRIVYLCLEDARAVRAALCAGRNAGLMPNSGTVWILPAGLSSAWLQPKSNDLHNCTREQLDAVAAGHFTLGPDWLVGWADATSEANSTGLSISANAEDNWRSQWRTQWRTQCHRLVEPAAREAACARPGPHAALLYDVLRLWANALDRLFAERPSALDDLHNPTLVRSLVTNAVTENFRGVTGTFEWNSLNEEETTYARETSFVLAQEGREVARWRRGALAAGAAPRWRTPDGAAPDDGAERCALRPLADLLRVECAAAFAALGALLLALSVAILAVAALYCKRRTERRYRAKLEALGLHTLAAEPAGLDRWELPRERVVINRKLGMGAFGTVYGGHALLAEDRTWTAVAVKTLKPGATVDEKLDFLSEAEAMKRFDHKNVVRLLAVVTKTEPVCTVMEFMLYGDLKNYLLARRHLAGGAGEADGAGAAEAQEQVSARRLTAMALDAARALSYLAQLRYVHRDVAARNCLVSSRRVVKLADFGMTRLVFENDYYRFSRKGMLPVRWMAPESLALGVFSPASDVWSFGVLLYEIVTFGSLPFQGLSNSEVLARVKAGHTLDLPLGIKPQLEEMILSCWQRERQARPSAAQLAAALADAPRLLAPCLDVPLDALPLDCEPPWRLPPDRAEARWVSWGAPASAATDTTYLSDAPRDCDRFLP